MAALAETKYSYIGHYIKTFVPSSNQKQSHVNISVLQNIETSHLDIIIKPQGERKENTSYFKGTSKRATKSVKLTLNPDGLLTVSPVMAIKANNDVDAESVSDELQANALPTASCLFVSGDGKRKNSVRHYQANKGVTVAELIQDKQNKDQQKIVQMALRYMDQVGSQLNALHENGAAHFDCKLENILYDENSRQFTVIDIPERQYDPCVEDPQQDSKLPYTPGYTSPPNRSRYTGNPTSSGFKSLDTIFYSATIPPITHLGHVNDSYAYLRGLYEIAAAIPDTQAWQWSYPPRQKTALKRFVLRQMDDLNKQILAYKQDNTTPHPHTWPVDNMTVAKVKNAFTTFCETPNNPLNKAYTLLCAQPSPTAQSDDSASPVGHDVVLKEVLDYQRKDSLIHVIWELLLRTFYPISTAKQAETKKALSSIKTLMMYFTPESQKTGWLVVEDAKHIKSARFQEERLRLARVLVVAEVTQTLQESPGVNVEDCVTQVMDQRLGPSPSGNTTASPDDDFSPKLRASQGSIAQTVRSIQPSLPKCASFTQHIEKSAPHMKTVANLAAVLHPNKPSANRR